MKRRRERIKKELSELRRLKAFKKRVLNRGKYNANTSTNKKSKKKSIKPDEIGIEEIGHEVRSSGEIDKPSTEGPETTT